MFLEMSWDVACQESISDKVSVEKKVISQRCQNSKILYDETV